MRYAIDSETSDERHAGWVTGIRVGSTFEDRVTAFIPGHPVEGQSWGAAGEGVAVDTNGNVYAGGTDLAARAGRPG